MDTKTCTKCGETYPATTEYFYARSDQGLQAQCVFCVREHNRIYREINHKKILERKRNWYAQNQEKECERNHKYRKTHPEKERERERKYYQSNPETVFKRQKRWRDSHPDKESERRHRRRARLLNSEGTHTAADIEVQKRGQTDKRGCLRCWWCGKVIKGNNYHVDHVIPLVKDGRNDVGNLVISCPTCNLRKQDKMPWEFNGRLI